MITIVWFVLQMYASMLYDVISILKIIPFSAMNETPHIRTWATFDMNIFGSNGNETDTSNVLLSAQFNCGVHP